MTAAFAADVFGWVYFALEIAALGGFVCLAHALMPDDLKQRIDRFLWR